MANMDFSKLQCQDPAVLRKVKELPGAGVLYEEPGILEIETANGVPHEQIRAISGEFPQSSITCEYSYEAEWYSQIDVVEYLAGESRFIDVKRHYMYIGDLPPELADIKDSTLRQIEDFFAKVDVVAEEGARKTIVWEPNEIAYTLRLDHNGTKYKIVANKWGFEIVLNAIPFTDDEHEGQGPSDARERMINSTRPNVNRHITGQISTEVEDG